MSMRDRFFVRALHGTLPLWIWAAHFFASYFLVGAQCSPALADSQAPALWMLVLMTAAALGACMFLLWRALLRWRAAGNEGDLLTWAALGSGVLALAGIAWTSVPLMLLDGCG